jgi:hypothetical protein
MHSNCICELPIDALTFTEESGVIGLVAPRAIKMCNHSKDDIPTFLPVQMLRTYNNAKSIYELYDEGKNISFQLSDTNHGYFQADREAMIGWFNLHLKGVGDGSPLKEVPFKIFTQDELLVFPKGQRDKNVTTIAEYCIRTGNTLREKYLKTASFDNVSLREALKSILRMNEKSAVINVMEYADEGKWKRFALLTNDGGLIPLIVEPAKNAGGNYVLILQPQGKAGVSEQLLDEYRSKGTGIVLVDLWGTGEAASAVADSLDGGTAFHTLLRTDLLLGRSVMGEWVKETELINKFVRERFKSKSIALDGAKEAAISSLLYSSLYPDVQEVIVRDAPVSYLFDNRDSVDFYNMAVHLPGFLKWGDLSLAAALSGKNVVFVHPRTMSGIPLSTSQLSAFREE